MGVSMQQGMFSGRLEFVNLLIFVYQLLVNVLRWICKNAEKSSGRLQPKSNAGNLEKTREVMRSKSGYGQPSTINWLYVENLYTIIHYTYVYVHYLTFRSE